MLINKITPEDYPLLLRQIHRPPDFLYCAGGPIPSDDYKFLCVIGARKYSQYGFEACNELISGLKNYPIVIVSGLAIGIDSIAHEASLEAGLHTLAFPGSGLEEHVIYPPSRINLARKIVRSGSTLLSPFEPDQESTPWSFPVRNRLMAGISHATLIIEGRQGSGTLLTADYSLEFNRDVLVVPGSIFSDLSYGPHMLCKRGAIPVASSKEILEALGLEPYMRSAKDPIPENLSADESSVLQTLQFSPLSGSSLIEKTSLPATRLNIVISQLELKNLIFRKGDQFCKK